jgi:hypothetical protein
MDEIGARPKYAGKKERVDAGSTCPFLWTSQQI